jgi:prepilin-type N-terminal cleavage/methylation domain-containing protein
VLNGALRSHGVTLPELLIVLAILGVAAAAAVPVLSSGNPQALDLAAEEVASAMRFARSEAMRTGEPYGYRSNADTRRTRVFRADTTTSPWTVNYDVYHPVSKQLYNISLRDHPAAAVDSISHNRVYRGTCNRPRNVWFDTGGTPRCADPETVLLERYEVTLNLGPHSRIVTLHGITGRVTIQ